MMLKNFISFFLLLVFAGNLLLLQAGMVYNEIHSGSATKISLSCKKWNLEKGDKEAYKKDATVHIFNAKVVCNTFLYNLPVSNARTEIKPDLKEDGYFTPGKNISFISKNYPPPKDISEII
jgi:hypothetical protein